MHRTSDPKKDEELRCWLESSTRITSIVPDLENNSFLFYFIVLLATRLTIF